MRWIRRIYEKDTKRMAAEAVCHLLINSPLESSNVEENYGVAADMRYEYVWVNRAQVYICKYAHLRGTVRIRTHSLEIRCEMRTISTIYHSVDP